MLLYFITVSQIRSGLALVQDVSMAMMGVVQHAATALRKRYSIVDLILIYSHFVFRYHPDGKVVRLPCKHVRTWKHPPSEE